MSILDLVYSYLIVGVIISAFGPARKDIQADTNKILDAGSVQNWRVYGFAVVMFVIYSLLWPVSLPYTWQNAKERKRRADSPMFQLMSALNELGEEGTDQDALPNSSGEFGLSVTNPIPTQSIFGSRRYLSSLRTEDGQELTFERHGSTMNDISQHPIDIYSVAPVNGGKATTVYVSPYHKRNSGLAPRGFQLGLSTDREDQR